MANRALGWNKANTIRQRIYKSVGILMMPTKAEEKRTKYAAFKEAAKKVEEYKKMKAEMKEKTVKGEVVV